MWIRSTCLDFEKSKFKDASFKIYRPPSTPMLHGAQTIWIIDIGNHVWKLLFIYLDPRTEAKNQEVEKPEVAMAEVAKPDPAKKQVVNSMSHPEAWAFMHRLVKAGLQEKKPVPKEVIEEWQAGGATRNRLLAGFVEKLYVPGGDHDTNVMRLEAFIKIRQVTKEWRTSLRGYEWLTEEGMQALNWSETLGYGL